MTITVIIFLGLLLLIYVWRNERALRRRQVEDGICDGSKRQSPFAALQMLCLILTSVGFSISIGLGWKLSFNYELLRTSGAVIFFLVNAIWWGASLVLGLVWSILFREKFEAGAETPRLGAGGLLGMILLHSALGLWTMLSVALPPVVDAMSQPGAGVAGYALFFFALNLRFAYGIYLSSLIPLLLGMVFGWRLRKVPDWLARQAHEGH